MGWRLYIMNEDFCLFVFALLMAGLFSLYTWNGG